MDDRNRAEQASTEQDQYSPEEELCWVILERERLMETPVVEVVITYGGMEVQA